MQQTSKVSSQIMSLNLMCSWLLSVWEEKWLHKKEMRMKQKANTSRAFSISSVLQLYFFFFSPLHSFGGNGDLALKFAKTCENMHENSEFKIARACTLSELERIRHETMQNINFCFKILLCRNLSHYQTSIDNFDMWPVKRKTRETSKSLIERR